MSTTIIAAQKNSLLELVFDVIDINGANLTGQAASIVKSLRDPDGAASEVVTIVEQGATGFYKVSFTPTKGGSPPKNYYLRLEEPVGSAERVHQWQIQVYDALPAIAGPTGNLTTLAHVKEYLRITGSGDDALLTNLIARMSEWIRVRIRPLVVIQETLTERHTGDGGLFLHTDHVPILSVTSIHESFDAVFNASTLIASTQYDVVDADHGVICRKDHVGFYQWKRGIRIIYVAGYVATPLEIEQLAIEAVAWRYNSSKSSGGLYSSRTLKDGSVTYAAAGQGAGFLPSPIDDELRRIRQQHVRGAAA